MATFADRLLKAIEVLQPTLPVQNGALTADELKEATPQSRVAACKVIVHSLSHLSSTQHEEYNELLTCTFESLLSACNDNEADVRVAADEGLNHLINELYGSDSGRIQVELFKEIKRNASPRRVKAAIVRFAELAYLIKPQKCRAYVMNLLPLLIAVCNREEESIQESLITAMPKIVSVLGPFFSESELYNFLSNLFRILVSKLSPSRRMAAECITSLCHSCLKPGIFYSISLEKMLVLTINQTVPSHTLIGGFLGLRKILISVSELPRKEEDQYFFNLDHISVIFHVIFQSLSHSDHNVVTAALSTLQTLIEQTGKQLSSLLLTDVASWNKRFKDKTLGDFMLGTKHTNKNMLLTSEVEDGTFAVNLEDVCKGMFSDGPNLLTVAAVFLSDKFLMCEGEQVKGARVSVKSLVINCLTEFTVLQPQLLTEHLAHLPAVFKGDCDPMLQSNIMALCGTYILNFLQQNYYLVWSKECKEYIAILMNGVKDESPKVHKACCDSTRICIPALMKTTHSDLVIDLIDALMPLHLSSYWLVKRALLDVFTEIKFAYLYCFSDRAIGLQEEVLNAIFVMLSDEDTRVQSACANCFASIIDNLCFSKSSGDSVLRIIRNEYMGCNEFVNPPMYAICLPSDSSQHVESNTSQNVGSLSRLLNIILKQMISSQSTDFIKGCIETFAYLTNKYVNCDMLKFWGITIPAEQQKIDSHHFKEGVVLSSSSGLISFFTQYLTSSMYMYDIACHQNLLTVLTKLLGATCKHLISNNCYTADIILSWSLLNDETLVEIIQSLVYHIMRVLNICCHVCGEEDPTSDNSNFKDKVSAVANKRKKRDDDGDDNEPLIEQDGSLKVGSFTSLPHYMKFYDNLKASYEAHKVSLELQSDEKFVLVLRGTLSLFQEILKYSSLKNVGSFSEEVNEYLTKLLKKEPIQCVTTTRYILSSLFGTNVICVNLNKVNKTNQSMNIKRPVPLITSTPVHIEYFKYSPYIYVAKKEEPIIEEEPGQESFASKIFGKKFNRNQKKKVEKKQDQKPAMQNYIRYFEANVMKSLELYTLTNDTQVQGEILVLLIDLLRLRVNYSLLDTGKVFVNFLLRQFEYIEQGQIREASKLLPTLFQFLIMLTKEKYQEEVVIDIPRIMQLCGTAMASGQLNTASISVSLYPLIHELFVVQEAVNVPDIITQREVVESILLKNVIHYQVIDILWIVLHWYSVDVRNFKRYSASVWSAVSIAISQSRLDVTSHKVMISMHRLLDVICHDNALIINTLLEFVTAAPSSTSKCSYICLLLRYLLIIIGRGQLQSAIEESGNAMLSISQSKNEKEMAPIMKLATFLCWAIDEILEYLKNNTDIPYASFSSLNYIHKLAYHVREYQDFDATALDFSEIKTKTGYLSGKYPASVITAVNICRVFGIKNDNNMFDDGIVYKYHKINHNNEGKTVKHKNVFAKVSSFRELNLKDFAQNISEHLTDLEKQQNQYSLMLYSSSITLDYLVKLAPNIGSVDPADATTALTTLKEAFTHPAATKEVNEKIAQCLLLVGSKRQLRSVSDPKFKEITSDWLQSHFSKDLCCRPAKPLCIVPVLKDMSLHVLKPIISNKDFDTVLFVSMIQLGRRQLCAQKSAYVGPEELLPQLPPILLSSKSELLDRISILTGVGSPAVQSTKPVHSHSKSNSMSLPKSIALFVDTSAFLDPTELLQYKTLWDSELWRENLRNYVVGTTALLNTAILYPDIAYLSPYHIHAITRLLALALGVNNQFGRFSDITVSTELLDLLLAIIITRDTCAVIHYGEDMNIVENIYHILVAMFGKTLTKSEKAPETQIDEVRLMVNFVLYRMPQNTHHSLSVLGLVKKCILSLASLPCVSSYLRIPTFLALASMKEKDNTEFTLSSIELEFLKDSEVLEDFLYRNLSFGWSTKRQFEELWVTMLGMITYRFDPDMSKEEINELSVVNRLAIRGMTALLMQTLLHPVAGAPRTSIYQHFPRNQQIPFLNTTIGQRMIYPHKLIFDNLLNCCRLTPTYQPFFCDLNAFIDSEFTYCLIDTETSTQAVDKFGVFIHDLNRIPGSSSYCHGYYSATALRERIITNDVTDLDSEGMERTQKIIDETSDCPDILSCLHFLVDLFAEWTLPESNIPITLLNQIIDSVSQLSDMFQKTHHCQWMVDGLLKILIDHPLEDTIVHSKLLFTLSKAVSLLQADKAGEKLMPFIEEALSSDSIVLQQAAINGSFYLLESQLSCFEGNLVSALADFAMSKLVYEITMPFNYTASIWAVTVIILEKFPEESENCDGFTISLLQFGMKCLVDPSTPFLLYQLIVRGFQRLVISFSIPSSELEVLTQLATNQLEIDDPQKCLSSFGLLMTCMYCGREGSRVLQLERDQDTTDQMLAGAMDKMRKILDCVGHCCEAQAKPLAAVICYLVTDFFPKEQMINTFVSEFLSPRQQNRHLLSLILHDLFQSIILSGNFNQICEWVILVLRNFVQLKPLDFSLWSTSILLLCSSKNRDLSVFLPIVLSDPGKIDPDWFTLLCQDFASNLSPGDRDTFIDMLMLGATAHATEAETNEYSVVSQLLKRVEVES